MKPNPQCSNVACLERQVHASIQALVHRSSFIKIYTSVYSFNYCGGNYIFCLQKEYFLAKPARDAALQAKMEAEDLSATEVSLHADNEWNIRCFS